MSIVIEWSSYGKEGLVEGSSERVKAIEGFDGYFVSSYGRVLSAVKKGRHLDKIDYDNIKEKKSHIKVLSKNTDCYYYTALWSQSKRKMISNHRLVAQTFIDNPNSLPVVNHIDGNRLNNNVDNLEWCTQQENVHKGKLTKKHLVKDASGNTIEVTNLALFIRTYVRPGITWKQANGYVGHFTKLVKPKNGYHYIGLA